MSTSILTSLIRKICNSEYEFFFRFPNVIGVALGTKYIKGLDTSEHCIQVLVKKKIATNMMNRLNIIPKSYFGIKTDVIECGSIKANSLSDKVRPLKFGYSISPFNTKLGGTAGCLVSDGRYFFILSNNHVLSNQNRLPIGTKIIQPSRYDGGRFPDDVIAVLYRYSTIYFTTPTSSPKNVIDAAIAYIPNRSIISPYISEIGYVKGVVEPSLNLEVKKCGRSSGLTTGVITSTNATVSVKYSDGKSALFTDQIFTTSMSKLGDSGSLLLTHDNYAVGLLFASSDTATGYNPISTVLDAMKVKLILG